MICIVFIIVGIFVVIVFLLFFMFEDVKIFDVFGMEYKKVVEFLEKDGL